MPAPEFPITPLLPQIAASLAAHPRLVLEAPPGAGKTTQVPLALLAAPWLAGQRILMLEPRRLAARAAAGFMARQLGEEVGQTVGYRIRHESRVSAATRIEVVTEAILTRMLQDDPALDGIGALLFDEFHERNLHSDLGLALALDVQSALRPDLRIVLMSATLEGERLARFLDAPRVTSEGRSHPVAIAYLAARANEPELAHLRRALETALADSDGDVLVFLPGKGEIERARAVAEAVVAATARGGTVGVHALHGELALAEQAQLLAPHPPEERRIVLATNVAESSITLPQVRAVIDSGLAREPRYDPVSGFSRLETVTISQASANQRAGRAGRTAPGACWRLWPQSQRLDPAIRPELAQVELSPLALELAAWGSDALRWLDPPPAAALAEARARLQQLEAIDARGRITAHGRALLRLGTHPRLAHLVERAAPGHRGLACELAALIEARDPLRGEARFDDDLRRRIEALRRWRRERRAPAEADRGALAAIEQSAAQLRRRVQAGAEAEPDANTVGELLAHAYPDRIARGDPASPRRYVLANGRGARLHERSSLLGHAWLVASELRAESGDSLIQRAAPVDEAFLRAAFADALPARHRARLRARGTRGAGARSRALRRHRAGRAQRAGAARCRVAGAAPGGHPRARDRRAAVERAAAPVAGARGRPARLGAGTRLARRGRCCIAGHARRVARRPSSPGSRARARSKRRSWARRCRRDSTTRSAAPSTSTRRWRSPCRAAMRAASSTCPDSRRCWR